MGPAYRCPRCRDLVDPQGFTVRLGGSRSLGRPFADHRPAADETGPVGRVFRCPYGAVDRVYVVAVHLGDHVPAVGLETLGRIVAEPSFDFTVDGNPVVVVERDELAEAQSSGEGAGLVRDSLHQAAVADRNVGVVVDDIEAWTVELRAEDPLGECHADGVCETLPQRTGRGFHARGESVLGVPGCLRMKLTKAPQLAYRQVIAGQVQDGVQQHRAMAVRKYEAIAVGPSRVGGVVAQVAPP